MATKESESRLLEKEPGKCEHDIQQFASDVVGFSSQYGSDISISYTAYNICGKPSKYPLYGDFPQTFVMRTYGKWWDMAPSRRTQFMTQNYPLIKSQDYIDITFEYKVIPTSISIYETYNPGSVVRIWARSKESKWKLLWEGKSEVVDHTPNIFSPPLAKIKFCTNLLRLEFNHSDLDYYTEIDAICMTGIKSPCCNAPFNEDSNCYLNKIYGNKCCMICEWHIDPTTLQPQSPDVSDIFLKFLNEDYPRFVQNSNPSCVDDNEPDRRNNGSFAQLPDETMLKIFSYLDLLSLSRCSGVNRYFRALASDSLLYTSLNLQPYWYAANSTLLRTLLPRCQHLQKLDLSWCGNYGSIYGDFFSGFIEECGKLLTNIRLDCCQFVDDKCIETISSVCTLLQELTLHNCSHIFEEGFSHLSRLHNLQRLEFYRTAIEAGSLTKILKSSPQLKHLNLGSCCRIASMDGVAQVLGTCNTQLISVDFWKTYSLTPIGIKALSHCHNLEEIDIGWCLGVSIPGDCFVSLAKGCPKLRKLFMGSLRGIREQDLYPFVWECPNLEQIDLLGNRNVTSDLCYNLLQRCKKLKFLDVSFCEQISNQEVQNFRIMFPNVDIKRSFQNDMDCVCSFPNHY